MSIFWKSDLFGYDGDKLYGNVTVNYWTDREAVEWELERQFAEIRHQALNAYDLLMADLEEGVDFDG